MLTINSRRARWPPRGPGATELADAIVSDLDETAALILTLDTS